ncbi:MAG: class I SAM-dependent methyltransferase [Pseudomonadota bacterium]
MVTPKRLEGTHRQDVVQFLKGDANVGIELGVAAGLFSARMMESGHFSRFFGVDMYADKHDTAEYKTALRAVGLFKPYTLLRMRFEDALDLFEDETFDFIYVDGYAHSGEEGGETIMDWYAKLKVGGVMAGDDYDPNWPLVQAAVHHLIAQTGTELMVTDQVEDNTYSRYPTWLTIKDRPLDVEADPDLVRRGKAVNEKRSRDRRFRRPVNALLKRVGLKV